MNVQSPNFRMADGADLVELADRVRGRLREFAEAAGDEAAFRLAAEQMQKYQRRSVARGRPHW